VKAGANGSDRHIQRLGDLGVPEVFPGVQQQYVALRLPQAGENTGQDPCSRGSVDTRRDVSGEGGSVLVDGRRLRPGVGQILADLVAALAVDQVGCDPVQQRQRTDRRGGVPLSALEGDQKGLTDQIVRFAGAEPTCDVAMDSAGVEVEQAGEALRSVGDRLDLRRRRAVGSRRTGAGDRVETDRGRR